MKKRKFSRTAGIGLLIAVVTGIMLLVSACATTSPKEEQASGPQLWAQKCQSCHNAPPPSAFSTEQWDVIIYHMEIKANLTEKEAQKIVTFLKQ